MSSKYYAFDASTGLVHRDRLLSAISATGDVGVAHDQQAAAFTDLTTIVNLESIDTTTGDELYVFRMLGANASNFSDAVVFWTMELGAAAAKAQSTVTEVAGQSHRMEWRTERSGSSYRYYKLHLTASGTTPSIGFNSYTTGR